MVSTAATDGRDRREGGRWGTAQTAKNHVLYLSASALLLVLGALPASWLIAFGRALGDVAYLVGLGPRRMTHDNLSRAVPQLPSQERGALARRVYRELGAYLGEAVALLSAPDRLVPIPFEEGSREVLEAQVALGRGVIFASAHLGPWERVAGSLVHHGFGLTTLARETYDPRFMRLYARLRGTLGVDVIYRGGAAAAIKLVRALRRGRVLGFPMDLRSRVPSVTAPFLGLPAPTPVGPARVALRTGAPVVVGTAVRAGGGDGTPRLVLRVTHIPTEDLAPNHAGEEALTCRLNAEISARIAGFPEGWVWMHPRWGSRHDEAEKPTRALETRYTSGGLADGR